MEKILPVDGSGPLQPLREVILRADPLATRRWLFRAHDLLTDLRDGRIPIEHPALDSLPHPKAVEHLRALLIATGILPPDPGGDVRRMENDLPRLLHRLDHDHQQLATRWARWAVLPRLRTAAEQGHETRISVDNARRQIDQIAALLAALQHAGRHLTECTQDDIDAWFAGPGAARWVVRSFLTWARRAHVLPRTLALPKSYKSRTAAPADSETRWQTAKRLINDDTLDPVDRMAGALVVLYAQPLARIITLTTSDVTVTDAGVTLKLGTDPLELPEPFASLIQQLPYKRRDSTVQHLPNRWLFAGGHADDHIRISAMGARLKRIGIQPSRMRMAAAEQLAREMPPSMLAGILGLKPISVARHTSQSKGQWAGYAADRAT